MQFLKRVLPLLLAAVFLVGQIIPPSVSIGPGLLDENTHAERIGYPFPSPVMPLQSVPREARVAIYDESNATTPTSSEATGLSNNLDEIIGILANVGHKVSKLTTDDILSHKLLTADYDVFIMVNNIPRECITKHVKEFWLGGGGLLSFNGAMSFLWYEGIIFPGLDNDPRGLAWDYITSDTQNITSRHPTTSFYHISDVISEIVGEWATLSWSELSGSIIAQDISPLLSNLTNPDLITGFAVDSSYQGGRVVQLPGNGSSIPSDFESIIVMSLNWLIPKPTGRIVFDLSHMPRLAVDAWDQDYVTTYSPIHSFTQFRTLMANHTYTFDKLYPSIEGNLTEERLSKYNILIMIWPDLDFDQPEIDAVLDWVKGGGSLLVLGDRAGLGGDGHVYLNRFFDGFYMRLGTTDILDSDTLTPILQPATDSTTTLSVGDRNYLIISESIWGDTEAMWEENRNTVVAGHDFGKGRAILSGDMNIFDNELLQENDNARFAVNAINWLNAAQANVLLFHNLGASDDYGQRSDVALALNDLGLPYQLHTTGDFMTLSLKSESWDLVIIDAPRGGLVDIHFDDLAEYVDAGHCLIMSYWGVNHTPNHPLWAKLGFEYASDIAESVPLWIWDASHPIFNLPNHHSKTNFTPNLGTGDEGDMLTLLADATALAGISTSNQACNAVIVLGNNSQTLYNGFLIDQLTSDEDDSTFRDSIEFWENEIAFMMRPTFESTADLEFTEGEATHRIIWTPKSYHPSTYLIHLNGTLALISDWNGSQIYVDLNGVTAGVYQYQVTVYDHTGNSATDTVIVIVNPVDAIDFSSIVLLMVGGLCGAVIAVLVLVQRRRAS